ncbi:MAG: hypothetical protein Q7S40_12485 [Opitutaceae bacterium]|nr:hypothetical protein [Opitutaceae bacterium]
MSIAEIRKRVTGGFQPFVIRTSDGREFKVPHPEFIAIAPNAVAVVDDDGHINTIALLHISSIKDLVGRRKKPKHAA